MQLTAVLPASVLVLRVEDEPSVLPEGRISR